MKFEWKYKYVEDGQIEPDHFNRWAIDCYIFVHIDKALPNMAWCKELYGRKHMRVRIATIVQKGTVNGSVPSMINKYCACIISFEDAGNFGLSQQRYYYANNILELQKIVENQFILVQKVFKNCR